MSTPLPCLRGSLKARSGGVVGPWSWHDSECSTCGPRGCPTMPHWNCISILVVAWCGHLFQISVILQAKEGRQHVFRVGTGA